VTIIEIVGFLLILSLLVFVHELGHFLVAKRSGITVEEFAIGFPPRAVKLWQDEGRIKLDGQEYVIGRKLHVPRSIQPGVEVHAETSVDEQGRPIVTRLELAQPPTDETESKTPKGTRLSIPFTSKTPATMAGGPTIQVEDLIRPTEYTLNWIPFGGYVRMVGEEDPSASGSFASKSKRVRFAVLVAGSLMNLVTAVVFFTLTALSGVPEPVTGINAAGEELPLAKTVITDVVANTPASEAGLQSGDIVLGADDVDFNYIGDLVYYVDQTKGTEIMLRLERDGQIVTASLVPRVDPPENQGAMGVGISYEEVETKIAYYPLSEAIYRGVSQTGQFVGLTFYMPVAILRNIIPAEAARPTGPVGIYQQTASAVGAAVTLNWWYPVFFITAIVSTALAVTNLLPLPALDGGRIFFILIEAIRGKRVAPEKEGAIHFIGLALLVTLMLVVSYYDIRDPIPAIDWNSFF
jgi:regulator of sigma E protease